MSEFQCYQFKSFDRPLTEGERKEISTWSSRAQVTADSATFIYHYGDFRKTPAWVVEHYFDAMLYFANWGTRQMLLRIPASLIDPKVLKKFSFASDDGSAYINFKKVGAFYLLDMYYSNEDGGRWMEEDDFDSKVLEQIREALIEEDYRALYLLWSKFSAIDVSEEDEDEDDELIEIKQLYTPPPVPPNLKKLDAPLKAFIEFFEIDESIVSAAKAASADLAAEVIDYAKLLLQLSEKERVEWLERLIKGEPKLGALLKKRLEGLRKS